MKYKIFTATALAGVHLQHCLADGIKLYRRW